MSDMEITAAMLANIEAKAKAATPGPWQADKLGNVRDSNNDYVSLTTIHDHRRIPGVPNAEYIAAASPDVVLALIDCAKKREKEKTNFDDYFVRSVKDMRKLESICAWLAKKIIACAGNACCTLCEEKWCPQRSTRTGIIDAARRAVGEQK